MSETYNTGGGAYNAGELGTGGGDFIGRDRSNKSDERVIIGSNLRFEAAEGRPLDVEFARLDTRMKRVERGQDMVSLALLLLALLLAMQTIWMFASKATDLSGINDKISSINMHIIRIETKIDAPWDVTR